MDNLNDKNNAINVLFQIILGSVCIFLISVVTISKGFGIPVKSWGWLIGCYIANLFLQGMLYNSAKSLTR